MTKQKGPTPRTPNEDIETRQYIVNKEGCDPPSSTYIIFDCPFCTDEVKAIVWSLCGSGKRCECGAMFTSWGRATHFKQENIK